MLELTRNFGLPVAISITFIGLMIWIVRVSITHFLTAIKDATEERKTLTDKFTDTVDNHMRESTEKSIEQIGILKGLTENIKEMKYATNRHHEETLKLAGVKH